MKQRDFAAMMGISVSAQRNYEKGLRKPDSDYLERLANAGYDVKYLITGERESANLSREESELLTLWHAAPLLVRHAALNALATGQCRQVSNHIGDITGSLITGGIHQGTEEE